MIPSGLQYRADYLSQDEQSAYLSQVDEMPWQTDLKRRVQHYGYVYDYRRRRIDPDMYRGPLPVPAQQLAERLHEDGYIDCVPDQMIVNEYQPGQGISAHIDCEPCFGDTIVSVSLGSACVMHFTYVETGENYSLLLEPGSVLSFTGEARYQWRHSIPARKTDVWKHQKIYRSRRVSLTFRRVVL